MTSKTKRRMCVLAGILAIGASAGAAHMPQQINIDRALNSPVLTIRYSKAFAALVELRVNGESVGTRTANAAKNSGETNFTIDLGALKDGDNEIEVRLFDRTGKLIGSDKTNISVEPSNNGPVFLSAPKVGATVMGPVEIKVGFGRELRNSYVSFFVDSNFKSMTNFPPYAYLWDTEKESNGWHEVEAWVIDSTSNTYKTRKVRVFVNNPSGRTNRKGEPVDLTPTKNGGVHTTAGGAAKGIRPGTLGTTAATGGVRAKGLPPVVTGPTLSNGTKVNSIGAMSGPKAIKPGATVAVGPKLMTPTGKRTATAVAIKKAESPKSAGTITVAKKGTQSTIEVVNHVKTAAALIPITYGQRIPNIGSFAVVYNSQFVNFDVAPRVDSGIPMTPFRHLIEKAGGKVEWENMSKSVSANAEGRDLFLQIGDRTARIDKLSVTLDMAPYLERGRTIVPLSFMRDALNVNIEFDKASGHVLITTIKK